MLNERLKLIRTETPPPFTDSQRQLIFEFFFDPNSQLQPLLKAADARPVVRHHLAQGLDILFIKKDDNEEIQVAPINFKVGDFDVPDCVGVSINCWGDGHDIHLAKELMAGIQGYHPKYLALSWEELKQITSTHPAVNSASEQPYVISPNLPPPQKPTQLALFPSAPNRTKREKHTALPFSDLKVTVDDAMQLLHVTREKAMRLLVRIYNDVLINQCPNSRKDLLPIVFSQKNIPHIEIPPSEQAPEMTGEVTVDRFRAALEELQAKLHMHHWEPSVYYKRVTFSKIEDLPWLYCALGLAAQPATEADQLSENEQKKAARGVILHEIDALSNALTTGFVGTAVDRVFVTSKKEQLAAYENATEGLILNNKLSSSGIEKIFVEALDRYYMYPRTFTTTQRLSEEFINDPLLEKSVFDDSQTYKSARLLVQNWVQDVDADFENMTKTNGYSEIMVIFNFNFGNIGIQIPMRIDCIRAKNNVANSKQVAKFNISDLKTGNPDHTKLDPIKREVLKRQGQLLHRGGEIFGAKQLQRGRLRRRGKAYILTVSPAPPLTTGLEEVYLRWFDSKTGQITKEPLPQDDADFDTWLQLYAICLHQVTPETIKYLDHIQQGLAVA